MTDETERKIPKVLLGMSKKSAYTGPILKKNTNIPMAVMKIKSLKVDLYHSKCNSVHS